MDGGMWASTRSSARWAWDRGAGGVEVIRAADIPVAEGDIPVEVIRAVEEAIHDGAEGIRVVGDRADSVRKKIDLHRRMTLSS